MIVEYADQYKVDPLLLVAIMHHESVYCDVYNRTTLAKHNCSGIMKGGQSRGLSSYPNWDSFIKDFARLIGDYVYKYDRDTIGKIGARYAPVASSGMNTSWQGAVIRKYSQLWRQMGY